MTVKGIGADGYLRAQKESVYGSAITGAMTLLPVKPGTITKAIVSNIEQANIISSRLKQAPEMGRKVISGSLMMDMHPSLIGLIYNYMFGAADSSVAVGDGAYNHYWLQNLTTETEGSFFTIDHAEGDELEDQFISCMIHKLTIESDNEGLVQMTAEFVGKDYSTDNPRIVTFSYPTLVPFKFDQFTVSEAGLGDISASIKALTIEIDLVYDLERWKLGDDTIKPVQFNGIPQINMSMTVDADQQWIDAERAHTLYDFSIALTGSDNAGSTPTKYSTEFEFPGCRINPDSAASETAMERLEQELEFDCSYGGVPTDGSGTSYQFELKLTDTVATYTA